MNCCIPPRLQVHRRVTGTINSALIINFPADTFFITMLALGIQSPDNGALAGTGRDARPLLMRAGG